MQFLLKFIVRIYKKKILRFLTQYLPEMCSKLLQKFVPEYFTIVYIGIPLDISLKIPCEQFQDSPDKNSGKIWEEISQKPQKSRISKRYFGGKTVADVSGGALVQILKSLQENPRKLFVEIPKQLLEESP